MITEVCTIFFLAFVRISVDTYSAIGKEIVRYTNVIERILWGALLAA